MNHVTHTTALALKAAGFLRPDIKAGQYWYTPYFLQVMIIADNVGKEKNHGYIAEKQTALESEAFFANMTYAPTAVELLESLPPKTLAGFNNGEWSVMPAGTEMVFNHRNLAEAAAMAVMALNKNKESVETCQTCHIKPATEMHTCPYATEINDCGNECNCCDGCRHECAQDI